MSGPTIIAAMETKGDIQEAPALLRPVTAVLDAAEGPSADKWAVARTALDTHAPQVVLSAAAAVYAIAGLVLGSFVAELLVSAFGAAGRGRRRRVQRTT